MNSRKYWDFLKFMFLRHAQGSGGCVSANLLPPKRSIFRDFIWTSFMSGALYGQNGEQLQVGLRLVVVVYGLAFE